jgi:hypothetical protein
LGLPSGVVLGSPVPRLQKDWDQTKPRLPRTGNSQDPQRPQLQSGPWSIGSSKNGRPSKNWS